MIQRRKSLFRATPPKRSGTRIKARYKSRGGRHSDPAKLAWIRTLPCLLGEHHPFPGGPSYPYATLIEPHHHRPGNARATDRRVVPLCAWHHRVGPLSIERLSARGFAKVWNVDFDGTCERYEAEWQAYLAERRAP